jgi:hypothetical protein
MNKTQIISLFASTFSLMLVNCTMPNMGNETYANPAWDGDTTPKVTVVQPMAPDGLHTAEAPIIGQPMHLDVGMVTVGQGTCDSGFMGTSCSNETDTSVAFQIQDVQCDDDLCDVNAIDLGDATHGAVITITPKANLVTVNVTCVSGTNEATGNAGIWAATPVRDMPSFKKAE